MNTYIKPMNLETLRIHLPKHPDAETLDTLLAPAAQALKAGKTVAFPTETVYGIGANALNGEAALKIFEAKNRPADNPLIVHITELEALDELTQTVSEEAKILMQAFWPGPMTLILPKSSTVPDEVTAGLNTVAIRMPAHPVAVRLIELAGCPVAAPSANVSGRPSPTCGRDVADDLTGRVSVIVFGDEAAIGLESTVIDVTGGEPVILRPGGVTLEMVQAVLGKGRYDEKLNEKLSAKDQPKSPGMKYTHYAPKAKVSIFSGDLTAVKVAIEKAIEASLAEGKRVGVLSISEFEGAFSEAVVLSLGSYGEPEKAAAGLFSALREFDRLGAEEVFAIAYPEAGIGKALMNRMIKAAGHRVISV